MRAMPYTATFQYTPLKHRRGRMGTRSNPVLTAEGFQEAVFPPHGLETFALDTRLQAGLPLQQAVGYLAQCRHVLRAIVLAHPALVFAKGRIQAPVQRIPDAPVAADCLQQPGCSVTPEPVSRRPANLATGRRLGHSGPLLKHSRQSRPEMTQRSRRSGRPCPLFKIAA